MWTQWQLPTWDTWKNPAFRDWGRKAIQTRRERRPIQNEASTTACKILGGQSMSVRGMSRPIRLRAAQRGRERMWNSQEPEEPASLTITRALWAERQRADGSKWEMTEEKAKAEEKTTLWKHYFKKGESWCQRLRQKKRTIEADVVTEWFQDWTGRVRTE